MITKMAKDDVIAIGMRNRAGYLVEQYGYTVGLAREDGAALAGLLPRGYLEEVTACRDRVRDAMKEKALMAEESKSSTAGVNAVLRRAKEWRRTAVHRAKFAKRSGHDIPAGLTRLDRLESVPQVATSINTMVKWVEANMDAMPGEDVKDFIREGRDLYEEIHAIDAAQELKRAKGVSDSFREFYHQKGLLYIGIKGINDLGRALHRGNPASAARYNMSILYRHAAKKSVAVV
jgi:hypothetical protein